MIKPEQIPIEAVYAVADIVMGDNDTDCLREAIAAAINAWPGVYVISPEETPWLKQVSWVKLPMSEKNKNE